MSKITLTDRQRGSVLGLAYGDAWGWITEFAEYSQVAAIRPEFPYQAVVTDDTQMSLYAINAIMDDLYLRRSKVKAFVNDHSEANIDQVRLEFAEAFIKWSMDPDNDRAPGITCMTALQKLYNLHLETGLEGTSDWSKGCGANMRNPWFGLLPFDVDTIAELSVIQSSVTHNAPLALSASALTALVVKGLVDETVTPGNNRLFDYTIEMTEYLIQHPFETLNLRYMDGLIELQEYLVAQRAKVQLFEDLDNSEDICGIFGEGKVAEEALVLAIVAADHYQDDVLSGYARLVHSSGDTDSIAAIAGSFFGAAYGDSVFPAEWFGRLESRYSGELREAMENISHLKDDFPQ